MKIIYYCFFLFFALQPCADVFSQVKSTKRLTDDELLTLVQHQTFKYFWDFAHPVSGLSRERTNSKRLPNNEIVTFGGSGFGVMALIVGVERKFITREQGVERMLKILTFLDKDANHYRGVWPHWMNGTTGETTGRALLALVAQSRLVEGASD